MLFGVNGNFDIAAVAAAASYDFAEWSVPALLKPQESEDAFRASLEALVEAPLSFPVANIFVPGHMKITGEDADLSALQAYVTTTMERAERAGIEIIVFGSGGARRIPDGFDPQRAHDQLVAFCSMVAPIAHDHGVTVVIEPLNTAECNVLTTLDECASLVVVVDHPGIRLLVDSYHLMLEQDSYDDIVRHGDLLAHAHIATAPDRLAPGAEFCDFSRFFSALADAQYTGRLTIEARLSNPDTELPAALTVMRKWSDLGDSSQAAANNAQ